MFITSYKVHNLIWFFKICFYGFLEKNSLHKEVKMTIKKLTVAAAIAVGIATCSLNQAMAACPCATPETPAPCAEPLPVVTGPACPCETVKPNTCTKCKKAMPDCDCKKQKAKPCDPCEKPKKPDCDCPDEISCDKPADPACAICPQTGKPDRKDMKQVYGYPNAIYGTNNYVGQPANSIFSTDFLLLFVAVIRCCFFRDILRETAKFYATEML